MPRDPLCSSMASVLGVLLIFSFDLMIEAAPCTGQPPNVYGFPNCVMPEPYGNGISSWNEVNNADGIIINGAVCDISVCGLNGEWRQRNFPPSSTYFQTPFEAAYWGRYFTNGAWELSDGRILYPGALEPVNFAPTNFPTKASKKTKKPSAVPVTKPPTTRPTLCDPPEPSDTNCGSSAFSKHFAAWYGGVYNDLFDPCCIQHDHCYDACTGKRGCDNNFLNCMQSRCGDECVSDEEFGVCNLKECRKTAGNYYKVVDKLGNGAYTDACICGF